jgi:hypothetical protein
MTDSDKQSSLLQYGINYSRKKLITQTPYASVCQKETALLLNSRNVYDRNLQQ